MKKNILIIVIILLSVCLCGICHSSSVVYKKTFTHIECDQIWQIRFTDEAMPIGLVDFINTGKLMKTTVYYIYFKDGQPFIVVPNVATFNMVGENLYYPELQMTFYLDKN